MVALSSSVILTSQLRIRRTPPFILMVEPLPPVLSIRQSSRSQMVECADVSRPLSLIAACSDVHRMWRPTRVAFLPMTSG
jgi:hypothetical protein